MLLGLLHLVKLVVMAFTACFQSAKHDSMRGSIESQEEESAQLIPRPATNIVGIQRLGLTCYLNAVLQCLVGTQMLEARLKERLPEKDEYQVNKAILAFILLYRKEVYMVNPSAILNLLCRIDVKYSSRQQEDAEIALAALLTAAQDEQLAIQQELKSIENPGLLTIVGSIFTSILASRKICTNCKKMEWAKQEEMLLHLPLTGMVPERAPIDPSEHLTNAFGKTYIVPQPVMVEDPRSLEVALADYFKEDRLTGENYCMACKGVNVTLRKQSFILQPPETLILHLKRYGMAGSKSYKNQDIIRTCPQLCLDSYCMREDVDLADDKQRPVAKPQYVYDLYAIIEHVGESPESGHYTANIKSGAIWYHANDEVIEEWSETKVLTRQAYLLFYQLVHGPVLSP